MTLAISASGLFDGAKRLSGLIFYAGLLLGTGWYLAVTSRRPAQSERLEAFRKPARMLVLGYFLFAALALVMLTVIPPASTPPLWASVLVLILFVGSIAFIWRGTRKYFKAADANPGRHANPADSRRSRWTGRPGN